MHCERFRGISPAPRPKAVAPTVWRDSATVRGPALPTAMDQRSITVAPPDKSKPLHGVGSYAPSSPPVKPFRPGLSPFYWAEVKLRVKGRESRKGGLYGGHRSRAGEKAGPEAWGLENRGGVAPVTFPRLCP